MLKLFHKMGLPMNASAHGGAIDDLMVYLHWFMLILFLGWGIFFLYTLYRFRSSSGKTVDPDGIKSHAPTYLEIAVIAIELLLLFGFAIPIWSGRVNDFPKPESGDDVTTLHVIAQQFVWNMHYPGPDGKFGKRSAELVDSESNPIGLDTSDPDAKDDIWITNDLRVPVNKPVLIKLTSLDVIHSFSLPNMRIKQDVVPGMEIPVWFKPVRESGDEQWQVACAQLCGVGHYRMAGQFHVVTENAFQQWYEERLAEMTADAESDDW
jgi:cytochrome c oxidase subunit 2